MLTYKVLLVDDEEEVMDVIEHRICWKQMGFEVVGKAQNGVKALEIPEKMQPDIYIGGSFGQWLRNPVPYLYNL